MTDLPDPLTPPGCDLRDFAFMPLDVQRLRDSGAAAMVDAEAFRACVLAWCASWHQTPAGSLPNDDAMLSVLLGYGRVVAEWVKVRKAGGLHGWVLCSDGRLYHPVVAEKANEAWERKRSQKERSKKGNDKRWSSKKEGETVPQGTETNPSRTPEPSHKDAESVPQGSDNDPIRTENAIPNDPNRQGQGQGEERKDRSLRELPRRSAAEEEFEAFWKAYPKRVGKEAARKSFNRVRRKTSAAVILAAVRQADWSPDPQFVPYPATWLNQGRWQDELPVEQPERRSNGQSYAGCL